MRFVVLKSGVVRLRSNTQGIVPSWFSSLRHVTKLVVSDPYCRLVGRRQLGWNHFLRQTSHKRTPSLLALLMMFQYFRNQILMICQLLLLHKAAVWFFQELVIISVFQALQLWIKLFLSGFNLSLFNLLIDIVLNVLDFAEFLLSRWISFKDPCKFPPSLDLLGVQDNELGIAFNLRSVSYFEFFCLLSL